MGSATVVMAAGTRRGTRGELNQDVVGLNGWALHADASGALFPPWRPGELTLQLAGGNHAVFVVADGVGSAPESHTASLLVAEAASRPVVATARAQLREELEAAHRRILAIAEDRPAAVGIGSTVAGLIVQSDGTLGRFNLGDSRIYFTNVGSLVNGSRDDREQIAFSTRRRLSAWVGQPGLDSLPLYTESMLPVTDRRVLLCSDGLYESVDEQTMQSLVLDPRLGPAEIVQRLLDAAGEPPDDATAVLVHITLSTGVEYAVTVPTTSLANDRNGIRRAGKNQGRRRR